MGTEGNNALFRDFEAVNKETWKAQILSDIKAASQAEKQALYEQKMIWQPEENIAIAPFYTGEDITGLPLPLVEKTKTGWQNCERIPVSSEKEANQLAAEALTLGADALCFDFHPNILLALNLTALLHGIKMADTPVCFKTTEMPGDFINSLQKIAPYQWRGSLNYDPVTHLAKDISLPETAFKPIAQAITTTADFPNFQALTINSHYFHKSGASVVQELAFSLAAFIDYVDQLTELGVKAEAIFHSTAFSVSVGTNYFMEIAKCRSLRVLFRQLAQAYGIQEGKLAVHVQTAQWNKSAKDPYNNMIRATIEAMAAILGGCDALTVLPYNQDSTDTFARRIARNVSAILKEESYFDKVADIAAGSYYIENLTYTLAQEAWLLFQDIEARGGFIRLCQSGFIQEELAKARIRKENELQNGKQVLVGVNKYVKSEK